jgi:hypothetical protein
VLHGLLALDGGVDGTVHLEPHQPREPVAGGKSGDGVRAVLVGAADEIAGDADVM